MTHQRMTKEERIQDDRWLTAEEHEELRTLANGFAPQEDGINESRMAWLSVRALYEIAALEDEVASLQSENASLQEKVDDLAQGLINTLTEYKQMREALTNIVDLIENGDSVQDIIEGVEALVRSALPQEEGEHS